MERLGRRRTRRPRRQRGDRVQAGGGQPHALQAHTAARPTARPATKPMPAPHREPRSRRRHPKRDPGSTRCNRARAATAIGSLMPDSPSSARASRRLSVEPRSTANTAAASVAATVEPSSSAYSKSRSRISQAARAAVSAPCRWSRRRERDRHAEHRPDLGEAAAQTAFEEDQRQRDDAGAAGELVVVEGQQLEPVGAEQHAQPENEHEAREPQPPRGQRGGQPSRQQDNDPIRATCPSCTPGEPCQTQPVQVSRVSCAARSAAAG